MLAFLVALAGLQIPSQRSDPSHVAIQVRCDPVRVQPGGFVDVIVELEFDPGWHGYAPSSPGANRMAIDCELPEVMKPVGTWIASSARLEDDAVLGKLELLEGRAELRRHHRVALDAELATKTLQVVLQMTVCDAFTCLPPRKSRAWTELTISRKRGSAGPAPYQPTAPWELDASEQELLGAQGFVGRAWLETPVVPGEVAFAVLEVVSREPRLGVSLAPSPYVDGGSSRFRGGPYKGRRFLELRISAEFDWNPGLRDWLLADPADGERAPLVPRRFYAVIDIPADLARGEHPLSIGFVVAGPDLPAGLTGGTQTVELPISAK